MDLGLQSGSGVQGRHIRAFGKKNLSAAWMLGKNGYWQTVAVNLGVTMQLICFTVLQTLHHPPPPPAAF